jgi:hypothetical protein
MEKKCFKCDKLLPLNEFYVHNKMADGHLNKCKSCSKNDVKKRYENLSKDKEFIFNERKRGREKYKRLYSDISKPKTYEESINYKLRYPEKYKAKIKLGKTRSITKGNHLHHWSYNEEHYKDVIELDSKTHYFIHRYIIYDQERFMYRRFDNMVLLDTKEKHLEFLDYCIKNFEY